MCADAVPTAVHNATCPQHIAASVPGDNIAYERYELDCPVAWSFQNVSIQNVSTNSSWPSSTMRSCCFECLQGQRQPQTAARLHVRCAAADRNGDAAEPDSLRLPKVQVAGNQPQQSGQAMQQQPPLEAGASQGGGTLTIAEQKQAMAAAFQQGFAALQRNSQNSAAGQPKRSDSVQLPPPPAGTSLAVVNGKKAALAILQQHDTHIMGNRTPAAGRSQPSGTNIAAPPTPIGVPPAAPLSLKGLPAAGLATANGVHPPQQQQRAPVGHPAQPSPPVEGRSPGGVAFGPQLPTEAPMPRKQWPPKAPEAPLSSEPFPSQPTETVRPSVVEQ